MGCLSGNVVPETARGFRTTLVDTRPSIRVKPFFQHMSGNSLPLLHGDEKASDETDLTQPHPITQTPPDRILALPRPIVESDYESKEALGAFLPISGWPK